MNKVRLIAQTRPSESQIARKPHLSVRPTLTRPIRGVGVESELDFVSLLTQPEYQKSPCLAGITNPDRGMCTSLGYELWDDIYLCSLWDALGIGRRNDSVSAGRN